jgi:hypothetical protein
MRQTAVLSFLMLLLLSAGAKAEEIVGKWEGKTPQGEAITYEFKEDHSVIWNLDSPGFPGPITAKYSLDSSTEPMQLDMSDFSVGMLKGVQFVGIIEFLSPTKIKIDGIQAGSDELDKRPKQFTGRAIEFSKVE